MKPVNKNDLTQQLLQAEQQQRQATRDRIRKTKQLTTQYKMPTI